MPAGPAGQTSWQRFLESTDGPIGQVVIDILSQLQRGCDRSSGLTDMALRQIASNAFGARLLTSVGREKSPRITRARTSLTRPSKRPSL